MAASELMHGHQQIFLPDFPTLGPAAAGAGAAAVAAGAAAAAAAGPALQCFAKVLDLTLDRAASGFS